MSTSPISPSSGFPPSASLPDEVPEQGGGDGPDILEVDEHQHWSPHGGIGEARDRPLPTPGLGGLNQGGHSNGAAPNPPGQGQGQPPSPIADTGAPGAGAGKPQVGGDTPGGPGAGMRPPGGADITPRPGSNPGGMPGSGYSNPGQNGQGNGYGLGQGNGYGLGNTLGNLANGLLGRGGVLAAPLAMLNGATQGGLGNVLAHATPIPLATPAPLANGAVLTSQAPAGTATPNPTTHATSPANASVHTTMSSGTSANANASANPLPRAATAPATAAGPASAMPTGAAANIPTAAPLRGSAVVTDPAPTNAAVNLRAVTLDPAHAAQQRGHAGAANEGAHTPPNQQAAANATRQTAVQALVPSGSVLTLMVAPHAELAAEDTRTTSASTLFREQGVDGRENVRDILGRSYVYTADGKLITRAQERTGVDSVDRTLANELDEVSMSNHGELSTHDLLFKVVVPAFAGMAALLGGATAGAGIATGASGMGGSFLLLAAAAVLGYGATRAIVNLRELSAAGADLNPLASRAAFTHWAAAGTQSSGSLAAIALLLF